MADQRDRSGASTSLRGEHQVIGEARALLRARRETAGGEQRHQQLADAVAAGHVLGERVHLDQRADRLLHRRALRRQRAAGRIDRRLGHDRRLQRPRRASFPGVD
jgi:hypothetical protein